jgi:hypothetical protein
MVSREGCDPLQRERAMNKSWAGEASLTFRLWLSTKASDLREAVLSGETTDDDIVLAVAEDLEQMAMCAVSAEEPEMAGAPYSLRLV